MHCKSLGLKSILFVSVKNLLLSGYMLCNSTQFHYGFAYSSQTITDYRLHYLSGVSRPSVSSTVKQRLRKHLLYNGNNILLCRPTNLRPYFCLPVSRCIGQGWSLSQFWEISLVFSVRIIHRKKENSACKSQNWGAYYNWVRIIYGELRYSKFLRPNVKTKPTSPNTFPLPSQQSLLLVNIKSTFIPPPISLPVNICS